MPAAIAIYPEPSGTIVIACGEVLLPVGVIVEAITPLTYRVSDELIFEFGVTITAIGFPVVLLHSTPDPLALAQPTELPVMFCHD